MIDKNELTKIARRKGYPPHVIEKDYALTWTLKAIYSNQKLSEYLTFKGGTCLSKVYAENYRLSEDLDFSACKNGIAANEELKQELAKAFRDANAAGAPNLALIEKETRENPGLVTLQVKYVGPISQGRVKIEVSLKEHVIYASEERVSKEQSYTGVQPFKIHCYALIEILAEKLRAIMQRGKTRDYYDVWQIMARKELREKAPHELFQIRRLLKEKCDLNGIDYKPELMFDEKNLEEAKKYWKDGLQRLVKSGELPEFDEVINELKKIFWAEDELAQFNKDMNVEHVRSFAREEHTDVLLERSVAILLAKLDSKKVSEVLKALIITSEVFSKTRALELLLVPEEIHAKVEKLAKDNDEEIKKTAKMTLEIIKFLKERNKPQ